MGSTCNLHENLFHHKQRQTALLFGPWLPGNGHLSADGSAAVRPSTSSVQLHNNHCSRIMKDSVFWSSLRPTFPPHSVRLLWIKSRVRLSGEFEESEIALVQSEPRPICAHACTSVRVLIQRVSASLVLYKPSRSALNEEGGRHTSAPDRDRCC